MSLVLVLFSHLAVAQARIVRYVDDDAPAGGDGQTWDTAFRYLQDALALSAAGDEIRVAAGRYTPDRDEGGQVVPGDRSATFELRDDVLITGGYRGCPGGDCSSGDPDQHDLDLYESVLSGDLLGDDGRHFARNTENTYNIVNASGTSASARLDGFTICGGNASSGPFQQGAGLVSLGGSPTITRCTFLHNEGLRSGAVYVGGETVVGDKVIQVPATITLIDCTFRENRGSDHGGGLFAELASAVLIGCDFDRNSTHFYGGGADLRFGSVDGSPSVVVNCRFTGNRAALGGGLSAKAMRTTLVNCLFSANHADERGGGILADNIFYQPDYFTLINCTVVGNSAGNYGAGVRSGSASGLKLTNCILWGNRDEYDWELESAQLSGGSPIINYSCVEGWTGTMGGIGNGGDDPLLVESSGPDTVPGTLDDNPRLRPNSPCIDAADNTALPPDQFDLDGDGDTEEALPLDADTAPRRVDDPDVPDTGYPPGDAPLVDMGAYEGAKQAFVISGEPVTVPEGGDTVFQVALAQRPQGSLSVTVDWHSGDPDITISGETVLTFNPGNYSVPQDVAVSAAEDPDFTSGQALLWLSAPGVYPGAVTVQEVDNEPVPSRLYVDESAAGQNTGMSWADACTELIDAVAAAQDHPEVAEIWVASGTYSPAGPGGPRTATFQLRDGLAIYGGFGGDETNLAQRDPRTNETILSGDLDGDDPGLTENSFHVVTTDGTDHTAVLDGFIITAAFADEFGNNYGGGLHNLTGSPSLANLVFLGNIASFGAGMYSFTNSSPTLTNCAFIENTAGTAGGLASGYGGGDVNQNHPNLVNCAFVGNHASGALPNGGGMWSHGHATLVNTVFWANTALNGGGFYDEGLANGPHPQLTNSILWGNIAAAENDEEAQIYSWVGTPIVNYSCVQGWTGALGGAGNFGDDPLFLNPSGPDLVEGTADDDLHLIAGSPCIDAGHNGAVPDGVTIDLDANPRFLDDPLTADSGAGACPLVDVGPYEYQEGSPQCCPGDLDGSGAVDATDLALLLGAWGPNPGHPADLNGDDQVNATDLAELLGTWGPCEQAFRQGAHARHCR